MTVDLDTPENPTCEFAREWVRLNEARLVREGGVTQGEMNSLMMRRGSAPMSAEEFVEVTAKAALHMEEKGWALRTQWDWEVLCNNPLLPAGRRLDALGAF